MLDNPAFEPEMALYQITLAYDGTLYSGFQRQKNARTIQAELENTLKRLGWDERSILAAGRTDAGVHASGQVVSFRLEWKHSCEDLMRALNANLPPDVSVRNVTIAAAGFHPRYDARWRRYVYQVYFDVARNPLRDQYAWRVYSPVDVQLLDEAASLLCGQYDFAAFGTSPLKGGSTVRTVFAANWLTDESDDRIVPKAGMHYLRFEVIADAFLYHMVRRMVFLQVLVGQGQLSLQKLALAVQKKQPQIPGLAPPHGLFLAEVCYSPYMGEVVCKSNHFGIEK